MPLAEVVKVGFTVVFEVEASGCTEARSQGVLEPVVDAAVEVHPASTPGYEFIVRMYIS